MFYTLYNINHLTIGGKNFIPHFSSSRGRATILLYIFLRQQIPTLLVRVILGNLMGAILMRNPNVYLAEIENNIHLLN